VLRATSQTYLKVDNYYPKEVSALSDANMVQVNIAPSVNTIFVYSSQMGFVPDVWIRFTGAGKIVAFSIPLWSAPILQNGNITLFSSNESFNNLKRGDAFIAGYSWTQKGDKLELLPSPPKLVTVQSVTTAYYVDGSYDYLIPVCVFEGVGLVGQENIRVTVAIQARDVGTTSSVP
jgi:hypothetical protein